MTNIGLILTYLSINISKDLDVKTLTISQFKYIRKILADHGFKNYSSLSISINPGLILTSVNPLFILAPKEYQVYRLNIGSLNYLTIISRPDIIYTVSRLS